MKNIPIAAAVLFAGCVATPLSGPPDGVAKAQEAQAAVDAWTAPSALEARVLLEEYGAPDEVAGDRLAWVGRGPWDRVDVWNAPLGAAETPVVQQTVGYPLDEKAARDVRAFDPRVICDLPTGRLSARSDSEEKNYLLLNLADDVVNGRKTPDDARAAYKEILDRSYSGKSSPYLRGLLFRFGSINP